MARLTEEMVIARSKQSDLSSIRKLNCWGAELGDVSLLRRMPNVEVLAFSINKIRTLVDFAGCRLLRELYVRKNEIRDLREIRHLRHLPELTSLWLDENPCTHHPQYRLTVLRNLPRLEKLDNVPVQDEELQEAMRRGSVIDSDDEGYPQPQEAYAESVRSGGSAGRCGARARSSDSSPERDEPYRDQPYRDQPYRDQPYRDQPYRDQGSDCSEGTAPEPEPQPARDRGEPPAQLSAEAPAPADDRGPPAMTRSHYDPCAGRASAPPLRHSASAHSVQQLQEYAYATNGECRLASPPEPCCDRDNRSEYAPSTPSRSRAEWEREPRDGRDAPAPAPAHARCAGAGYASAVMAERRGFTRRPVARNSNLLSAVLCLVKELDYPSLEVAEMAVRCRMDELAGAQAQ